MSLFDLSGKRIVVTGGSGHLGAGICRGLIEADAKVLNLSSKPLDGVGTIICDVSNEADVQSHMLDFGIEGLVQCACRAPRGLHIDIPADEFTAALHGIVTQYFTVARAAMKFMPRGGVIVNLASMWGLVAPNPAVYLDLKNEPALPVPSAGAGLIQLTKYLAVLGAKQNIRCNALIPGWFPKKRGPDRPDYMAEICSRVPMGRIGQPEEIVGPALFLLSNASSYMTGQQLIIDGGYTIQ